MLALANIPPRDDREKLLENLRLGIEEVTGKRFSQPEKMISTGCQELNQLLPGGGLRSGSMTEWLGDKQSGAPVLALLAAREAAKAGAWIVASDRTGFLYAAAMVAGGIPAAQLIIVRPANARDELWAINQALRCSGVAAVWACIDQLGERDARKLQLAAEAGGTLGLFIRPARARGQPTWADVQFLVEPQPSKSGSRRLRIETTRLRQGAVGKSLILEIEDATGDIRAVSKDHDPHLVPTISELAAATPPRCHA